MKVGIITFFRPINTGAVLQACATNRIISDKLGIISELLDYRLPRTEYYRRCFNMDMILRQKSTMLKLRRLAGSILFYPNRRNENKLYDEFIRKYLRVSDTAYSGIEALKDAEDSYDAFITGSDLVWSPLMTEGVNPVYFLEFAPGKKRISYAASIGENDLSDALLKQIAGKADKLDYISLRESTTAQQLQKYVSKKVYTVLDPTLLTHMEDWEKFYACEPICKEKYIFAYCLEDSDIFIRQVNFLSETYGYKVITNTSLRGYSGQNIKSAKFKIGPSEFLNYVRYAQIVVTNSFHGCAFSIIFHKDFYCIPHSVRGIRMTDIMSSFKIDNRIIQNDIGIRKEIDYAKLEDIRENMIAQSMDYLHSALKDKKI